ncbi:MULTISPECIES: SDR family oxidoreductase [Brevibacterium]|uniref:NAD(P)-dependent dehydrogenase, short-chain alcohol dehydrogenase family n=1 Tax=Brevibacterium antiquum CNRZ 918 TaxID=1255637 RepID=A0A2H1HR05_9MICO|nr:MULTISPECIES: SDR family oxidoreductase [Brevibacterium]SMX65355.1 NAD(P)-dependent dehydrogenase, short-chain alcohol dehydrogenase family [Brevibacterium antiquum CNRZ 918]HCG56760.1 short-chain dehydrogenase [Brevibacterium sp.]
MTSHNGSTAPEFAPFVHRSLDGRVALVAGATRGAGRAIARDLARAGAFVYCTGRSTSARPSDYGRDETIVGTAKSIREEGGHAEALVCDHLHPAMIGEVVRRIDEQHGRLDILVNDIGGEAYVSWGEKFWDTDFESGMRLVNAGLLTHLNTAHAGLPLLTRRSGGLHIEITDGTPEFNDARYRDSIYLDLTKTAVSRLAFGLGHELADSACTAVAITPGWLRSEMMLDLFDTSEQTWMRDSLDVARELPPADFAISESPHFLGRTVVALASDPEHHRFNTTALSTCELGNIYDIDDIDGSRPDSWAFVAAKEADSGVNARDYR